MENWALHCEKRGFEKMYTYFWNVSILFTSK